MKTLSNLFPLVIMVAVFWFLIIRPNRRRQQAAQALINSVGAGSKVVLARSPLEIPSSVNALAVCFTF